MNWERSKPNDVWHDVMGQPAVGLDSVNPKTRLIEIRFSETTREVKDCVEQEHHVKLLLVGPEVSALCTTTVLLRKREI